MKGLVIDLDGYAKARARLTRSERARPPRFISAKRVDPRSLYIVTARGLTPLIDPEVLARLGPVRDEDLPEFLRAAGRVR